MDLDVHSSRPLDSSRKKCVLFAMAVAVVAALCCFDPTDYWFWPKCPVKLLTGLNCPACGIQRFVHALAGGHLAEAVAYNYYLVYALPYAMIVTAIWLLPCSRQKDRLAAVFQGRAAIWMYVGSFVVWFVVRNLLDI